MQIELVMPLAVATVSGFVSVRLSCVDPALERLRDFESKAKKSEQTKDVDLNVGTRCLNLRIAVGMTVAEFKQTLGIIAPADTLAIKLLSEDFFTLQHDCTFADLLHDARNIAESRARSQQCVVKPSPL